MNNVLACESCGALYAAFVYRDKPEPHRCEVHRQDRPGIDGVCRGNLVKFGRLEPWAKP